MGDTIASEGVMGDATASEGAMDHSHCRIGDDLDGFDNGFMGDLGTGSEATPSIAQAAPGKAMGIDNNKAFGALGYAGGNTENKERESGANVGDLGDAKGRLGMGDPLGFKVVSLLGFWEGPLLGLKAASKRALAIVVAFLGAWVPESKEQMLFTWVRCMALSLRSMD
ncbi:unnamed protein product [Ilex paraguariensis]|uniref:Uncharacterized protein n=1 Tax=Ilex paraguariensis TaxID=185542 RepID=A0ABC8T875_9AQUA